MRFRKQMSLLLLCATASLLGGCGIGTTVPAAGTTYTGAVLQGKLYGGQQPIAGARVYLLAAGVGGYGGASVSLLNAAVTGNADSVGAYVLTGPTGSFTISGDYTCTGGSQVYLYALGGNPGTGTNSAAATMALLGGCPAGGKFTNIPLVTMNEVSTVAAAYAVAGYATDALHISSSGTPLAKTGIANAFANATNLVDLGLGTSWATTPGGNGTVPQTEINTLADILASCVNTSNTSTGAASASCSALFALATSDGTSTGTQPAETATAAINIAHHPALNVSALYAMNGGTTSPFQPILAVPPNDWTVRLAFSSGYGGTNDEQGHSLAVDGSGNIWAVEPYCQAAMTAPQVYTCVASSQIWEFNPLGVPTSTTGYIPTPYFLTSPSSVAVDATSSNLWIADGMGFPQSGVYGVNPDPPAVVKFSIGQSAGVLRMTQSNIPNLATPADAELDASGNVWVADSSGYLFHLDGSSGALLTTVSGRNNGCPACGTAWYYYSLAMEPGVSGNVWATSYNDGYVSAYSPTGVQQAGSPYFAIYGGWGSFSAAIDASGSVWLPGFHGMERLTTAGSQNPGSPFPILGTKHDTLVTLGEGTAIDGAGHAWMTTDLDTVYELDSQGNILSGLSGFVGDDPNTGPDSIAVDGSGNVWFNAEPGLGDATLYELVGAAAPVVTPIAYGVQTNQLGVRP